MNFYALMTAFVLVFARAVQQLNVVGDHKAAAVVTSYVIAGAEVGVVLFAVEMKMAAVPWLGTGGALGVLSAMYLHRKVVKMYRRKYEREQDRAYGKPRWRDS